MNAFKSHKSYLYLLSKSVRCRKHCSIVSNRDLEESGTWEDVGCMKIGSIFQAVNPEGCTIDPIRVTLVRTPAVPLHLPKLIRHSHVDSDSG